MATQLPTRNIDRITTTIVMIAAGLQPPSFTNGARHRPGGAVPSGGLAAHGCIGGGGGIGCGPVTGGRGAMFVGAKPVCA